MKSKKDNQGIWEIIIISVVVLAIAYLTFIYLRPVDSTIYLDDNYEITYEESVKAIEIMDEVGLYSKTEEWSKEKEKALSKLKKAKDSKGYVKILGGALYVVGKEHSFIIAGDHAKLQDKSENGTDNLLPEVYIKDNILVLKLCTTVSSDNSKEYLQKYADILVDAIYNNQEVDGVVIDLTENGGGSIVPMIGGLTPLIPEGEVISFTDNKDIEISKLIIEKNILRSEKYVEEDEYSLKIKYPELKLNKPVAILTSETTASAAEVTLISFMGLDYAKSFGTETAGFATGNEGIEIGKNITMAITGAKTKSRTGEIYENIPIKPDVEVNNNALEEAIKWIKTKK